ncbi:sialidase family protein [Wenzhouxiangella sediminis]|uniref:Exo-alpha-sialidase n=1 Tax=Wenzhouxiangella sediminis TaxID=1792836 RepID=A0A3E1K5T5_9GAMM|nr:sialidase family protein [Wenzhouxiangella sediminis]RFF29318.1 exo-alpha-sialidase [Wenzhouxiangella sediminis]
MINSRFSAVILVTAIVGALSPSTAFSQAGDSINRDINQNITLDAGLLEIDGVQHSPEAEHVFVKYLREYVPAQASDGTASSVPYTTDDEATTVKTRTVAKPVVSAFLYGAVAGAEPVGDENAGGFTGKGKRDAYAGISLDDGQTWKTTNLSESAAEFATSVPAYPGDVTNIVHAVAGRHIAVAWQSRYCSSGSPAYTLDDGTTPTLSAVATELGIDPAADLYLTDVFGVAGSQGLVDYDAQGYPTVGVVPYHCLWTARGVLVEGDDPRTGDATEAFHVVWYKPERLTSGRRDVNRVEIAFVKDAGVVLTWQEDPGGLLPGSGEGPGEGWSGAIANNQTDIWYSFLPDAHFETVDDTGTAVDLPTYWPANTEKPKPFVPFAVPMRMTNNARCTGSGDGTGGVPLYCTADALDFGLKNQCVDTVVIPTGQGSGTTEVCVSEDGLPNVANTAATRPRVSLQARTDELGNTIGAWVVVIAEESKGLGRFFFKVGETGVETATPCNEGEADCETADIGKNVWYFSFEMGQPQTSSDLSETGLVKNLVAQGNMLNQPEIDWRTGETFPRMSTVDMWDFTGVTSGTDYNFDLYRTEIARRGSLLVQPRSGADAAGSNLTALPLFKQGLMQQGGPADIMARRIVDAGASANPYDFNNLVCAERLYIDDSNPYYPKGICNDPAINLSGVTPENCATGGGGDNDASDGVCPTIDESGIASDTPDDQTVFDKMETWAQCPGSPLCGTFPESVALGSNLDDQSWYNPLDVAKGHRGYIWNDMVVVMYAWSPNWKRNTSGSDRYELYIRRSFDGGRTWTTTPADWGSNESGFGIGTTTCEFMRDGATAPDSTQRCTYYPPGAPEQARNVSQLQGSETGTSTYKFTILDPRYAPDPPTMKTIGTEGDGSYDYDSDEFNPTRFFVVYETGDNTTVVDGEAEALDLFFGRAVRYGDHYQVTADEHDMEKTCLPGPTIGGIFCNEFERLTTGSDVSAEESSLTMSPAGDTLYSTWAQFTTAEVTFPDPLSDASYARVWYTDENFDWFWEPTDPVDDPVMGDPPPPTDLIFSDRFELLNSQF